MIITNSPPPSQKSIQTLDLQLSDGAITGHGSLLQHTNGKSYYAWAENYNTGVMERRLYLSISEDGGANWSAKQQLTSGYWDDEPCLAQINITDASSEIAIAFTRSVHWYADAQAHENSYIYRAVLGTSGELTSTCDVVTGVKANLFSINLVCTALNYFIIALAPEGALRTYSNTVIPANPHRGFTDNAWVEDITNRISGDADNYAVSLTVRKIGTDHALLMSYSETIDGETWAGRGNVKYNLGIRFSSDDFVTFSAMQPLTAYADTPEMALVDYKSALAADLVQLSDASVAVIFQEFSPLQVINGYTTPTHAATNIKQAIYHSTHNCILFIGGSNSANPGLYVFNLTSQVVTRLFTSSTPPLWSTSLNRLAISSDDKYVAVASDLGVDVLDTTSATITSWTIQSFKTTSSPALLGIQVEWVGFDGASVLCWGYKSTSGTVNCWGGKLDLADLGAGITNLFANADVRYISSGTTVIIGDDKFVFSTGGKVSATDKSSGVALYNINISAATIGAYDDVNDEYVWTCSTGIKRLSAGVSSFTTLETFNTSGSGVLTPTGIGSAVTIPGIGILFSCTVGYGGAYVGAFYSFSQKKPLGIINSGQTHYPIDLFLGFKNTPITLVKSDEWIMGVYYNANILALPTNVTGRLRIGTFTYDADNQVLSNATFYDAANSIKLGTDINHIQHPRMIVDSSDQLLLCGRYTNWLSSTKPFSNFISIIEPSTYKLEIRARILKKSESDLEIKAKIQKTLTTDLSIGAMIMFAQCIKIQARIVLRTTRALDIRACIKGKKSSKCTITFDVNKLNQTRKINMTFRILGNQKTSKLQIRGRIIQCRRVMICGHFTINNPNQSFLTYSGKTSYKKTLSIKARIQK